MNLKIFLKPHKKQYGKHHKYEVYHQIFQILKAFNDRNPSTSKRYDVKILNKMTAVINIVNKL
jgi:hypothetical protein